MLLVGYAKILPARPIEGHVPNQLLDAQKNGRDQIGFHTASASYHTVLQSLRTFYTMSSCSLCWFDAQLQTLNTTISSINSLRSYQNVRVQGYLVWTTKQDGELSQLISSRDEIMESVNAYLLAWTSHRTETLREEPYQAELMRRFYPNDAGRLCSYIHSKTGNCKSSRGLMRWYIGEYTTLKR